MVAQIFISYSRTDKAFAQRLSDDLVKNGYAVWLDVKKIASGANWDFEVQRGLDGSDTMLVLLSPASVASQNVADEWSYFIERGKRIIPLMIQPCEVPFRISRRQRVDFTQNYADGLADLLKALEEPAPLVGDGPRPTEPLSRPLRVSWATSYNWWAGLRPNPISGEATVNNTELRLTAPRQFPFLIPLTSLISAQLVRSAWDSYLALQFIDRTDKPHALLIMGTQRSTRGATQNELLTWLKQYSGRQLS